MRQRICNFYFSYLLRKIENSTPQVYGKKNKVYDPKVWNRKNSLLRKMGIKIGDGVAIDTGFEWVIPENIEIRDFAAIGKNLKCYSYNKIIIGKFCMFAGEVQISNGTHEIDSFIPSSGVVEIKDGVWIGHGARIVGKNISIGENAIIGAGALVLSDVEPNSIVAGIPARKIGIRKPANRVWHLGDTYFSPETFSKLD